MTETVTLGGDCDTPEGGLRLIATGYDASLLSVTVVQGFAATVSIKAISDPKQAKSFSPYFDRAYEAVVFDLANRDPDSTISNNDILVNVLNGPDKTPNTSVQEPKRELRVFPAALNFGSLKVGLSRTLVLLVINPGKDSIVVRSVTTGGGDATSFSVASSAGFELGPSQSFPLLVSFAPTKAGSLKSFLTVNAQTGVAPFIDLTGLGVE